MLCDMCPPASLQLLGHASAAQNVASVIGLCPSSTCSSLFLQDAVQVIDGGQDPSSRDRFRIDWRICATLACGISQSPNRHVATATGINCDDTDRAAKVIQDELGIGSDDVINYCFPKNWPTDREPRAVAIIGDWLRTEARFLAS